MPMTKYDFRELLRRYQKFIYLILGIFILSLTAAILIYSKYTEADTGWFKAADFLMSVAETILIAGLIGGGIGGGMNFIFEQMKEEEAAIKEQAKEEELAAKEAAKTALENRQKYRLFRRDVRQSLGKIHDDVGLARILIKSHKSGKTYGEQIRNRIMPSLVSLQDIRRELVNVEDPNLAQNLGPLRVSLNYMVAYLSTLVREFEAHYLVISNLQNYQDALTHKMRTMFTNLEADGPLLKGEDKITQASQLLENSEVPTRIDAVWEAIGKLNCVWDFIDELRDERGAKSDYNLFFLKHYSHCTSILRSRGAGVNPRLASRSKFVENLKEMKRIDSKRNSETQLTNQDFLTWKMMEQEMNFDLKTGTKRPD